MGGAIERADAERPAEPDASRAATDALDAPSQGEPDAAFMVAHPPAPGLRKAASVSG